MRSKCTPQNLTLFRNSFPGEQSGYLGCSGEKSGESNGKECLWIIRGPAKSLVQLSWANDERLDSSTTDCPATANRVHIYDGLPNFVTTTDLNQPLGSFCLGQVKKIASLLIIVLTFVFLGYNVGKIGRRKRCL